MPTLRPMGREMKNTPRRLRSVSTDNTCIRSIALSLSAATAAAAATAVICSVITCEELVQAHVHERLPHSKRNVIAGGEANFLPFRLCLVVSPSH